MWGGGGASTKGIDTLGELNDELYQGKLVMAMVDSRSPFCNSGSHAILLYNYQPGGYVSVYDPYMLTIMEYILQVVYGMIGVVMILMIYVEDMLFILYGNKQ